jgi:hypothetical protein
MQVILTGLESFSLTNSVKVNHMMGIEMSAKLSSGLNIL